MSNQERIKELEEQIRYHTELYTNDEPEITDAEFDELMAELTKLHPDNSVLIEVGAIPSYGRRIDHEIPMGSLPKVTYEKDLLGEVVGDGMGFLNKWYREHPEVTKYSDKIDGCAGEIIFKNGKFIEASTRGNGLVGMEITDNVRAIRDIPTNIESDMICRLLGLDKLMCEIKIRGEFYIPRSFFNEHLAGKSANPRNAVAGAISCKDPKDTSEKGVKFFAYRIFIDNKQPESLTMEKRLVESIKGYHGINPASIKFIDLYSGKLNADIIAEFDEKRKEYDYETDGLVITIDNLEERDYYGWSSNGMIPNGAVAFKYKPEKAIAKILGITWQVGRTGKVTPVALLEPVHLAGSTITRCTLHNLAEIERLGVEIGDKVLLQKSGDIIPKIVRVVENCGEDKGINYPEICPSCGEFTNNDKTFVWCTNQNCNTRLPSAIEYYLKRLEIKDIGPAMINALVEAGFVKKLSDIYYLSEDKIMTLPNTGMKTANTVMSAICDKDEVELDVFLSALGISNLGRTTSKSLAKAFKTLDAVRNASVSKLEAIDDIGEVTASDIVNGLKDMSTTIDELSEVITIKDYEQAVGSLTGKSFCCTGTFSKMKRKEIEKKLESMGATVKSSVTSNLDYLGVGENAGSKLAKAKSLGVTILEEDELMEMIEKN